MLDQPVFQALLDLIGPLVTAQTYEQFLQHTQARLEALLESSNTDFVRKEAHSLRGTAGMFGASALAAQAGALEKNVVTGRELTPRIHAMQVSLEALRAALQREGLPG